MGSGRCSNSEMMDTFSSELGSQLQDRKRQLGGLGPLDAGRDRVRNLHRTGYRLDFVLDSIRSNSRNSLDPYPERDLFGPDFGMATCIRTPRLKTALATSR